MEQPKDYEVETFEDLLEQEYKSLGIFDKIIYHMQDYVLLVSIATFTLGYFIGTKFSL